MKIRAEQFGDGEVDDIGITLTEVYSGVMLDTEEGEKLGICMRDDAFEVHVIGDGNCAGWYTVGSGGIHRLGKPTNDTDLRAEVARLAREIEHGDYSCGRADNVCNNCLTKAALLKLAEPENES